MADKQDINNTNQEQTKESPGIPEAPKVPLKEQESKNKKKDNRSGVEKFLNGVAAFFAIVFSLVLLTVLIFNQGIFITVDAGEAGVLWYRFGGGTVVDEVLDEGLHVIFPWDKIYIYSIRHQTVNDNLDILTSNGLTVHVEYAFRFAPEREFIGLLHKEVGPDYIERVVIPEIKSTTRKIVSQHTPEELYADQKSIVEMLNIEAERQVVERYIILDDVMVKRIALPEKITNAVEAKLEQKQRYEEYVFRLNKEEQEKQRKIIEGEGIKAYQELVNANLTPHYLKWKGIMVTGELAQSNNAKVVIIGAGEGGLPVILGNDFVEGPRSARAENSGGAAPAAAENGGNINE